MKKPKPTPKQQELIDEYNNDEMNYDDDDSDWQPCADCDLPDACCDYERCAIETGLRKPPIPYKGIF